MVPVRPGKYPGQLGVNPSGALQPIAPGARLLTVSGRRRADGPSRDPRRRCPGDLDSGGFGGAGEQCVRPTQNLEVRRSPLGLHEGADPGQRTGRDSPAVADIPHLLGGDPQQFGDHRVGQCTAAAGPVESGTDGPRHPIQ